MQRKRNRLLQRCWGFFFVRVFVFPYLLGAGIAPFPGGWPWSGCQEALEGQRVISVDAAEMTGKLGSGNVFDSSR